MKFSGWDRVAAFACGMQLMPASWDFVPPSPAMYGTLCNYAPAFGSWTHCVYQVITEQINPESQTSYLNRSVDWANFVCSRAGGGAPSFTPETFWDAHDNATHYLQPFPADPRVPLHYPVVLNTTTRRLGVAAAHAEFANLDLSNDSAVWMYYYFGLIIAALFLIRLRPIRTRILRSRLCNLARARLELPTLFGRHTQHAGGLAFGGLVPSSFEAVFLAGFLIVHTVCLVANYSIDRNEYMESRFEQILQGVGNRSGILAFALLPLIVAFSARCQLFQSLCGLKYTTMLVFHRWTGRLMMIDSVIHSIAFYYHSKLSGELKMQAHAWFWITGIIATTICCAMVVCGVGAARRRWYELFLYSHIAMAIVFFYMCYEHVVMFGWTKWIWFTCILWACDRLYRLYLIARNGGGISRASLMVMGDDLLAVTIPKPTNWKSFPGQFAFIYFLHPQMFWQSHPFTLSDIGDSLRVVISVKSGATKRVYEHAFLHDSIPVLLEGPYGHDVSSYDHLLLFAGGSGIPGPLAFAEKMSHAKLVVVARNPQILAAYEEQLSMLDVSTSIYITRGSLPGAHTGRPDVEKIVRKFFSEICDNESGAVVCCGPPALNDQVRDFVAAEVGKSPELLVEYIEEYQVW